MSFKLFGIEFDGKKDCNSVGEKKMDEVCQIVGTKLIKEWIKYGKQKGKIKKANKKTRTVKRFKK